ncbi:MAG: Rrf2 family transcriptional regulator [Ruminococcus sp.]|nr:Rrf2 family transcriptional regulator [Ruminococcus sp.]
MQIASKFTVAVHILTCIDVFGDERRVTSDFLAGSTGVNPVIVRNVLSQLRNAGIVNTRQGSGGAHLAKPLEEITLYDIYLAVDSVDSEEGLVHFHENPNAACPVGRNIHKAMGGRLSAAQAAFENELKASTLADIAEDTKKMISEE